MIMNVLESELLFLSALMHYSMLIDFAAACLFVASCKFFYIIILGLEMNWVVCELLGLGSRKDFFYVHLFSKWIKLVLEFRLYY